ncbi:MAG TPA: UDP binding domain-containing protein, partial [Elusimicrobiota bacterium]|nr:UDP binding domain-containing protein [Elusimicrobiota bacterium]
AQDVLEAAGTKWNFLKFRPGLVGGHCIGVDPYYLTHQAEKLDYIPQVILAGRRVNDGMGAYIARRSIKDMIGAGHEIQGGTVTVLGLTFKEDVNDLRNSKVANIIRELKNYGLNVQVHDPLADPAQAEHEYGVRLMAWKELKPAQCVIAAVGHRQFRALSMPRLRAIMAKNAILVDIKGIFDREKVRRAGIRHRLL